MFSITAFFRCMMFVFYHYDTLRIDVLYHCLLPFICMTFSTLSLRVLLSTVNIRVGVLCHCLYVWVFSVTAFFRCGTFSSWACWSRKGTARGVGCPGSRGWPARRRSATRRPSPLVAFSGRTRRPGKTIKRDTITLPCCKFDFASL